MKKKDLGAAAPRLKASHKKRDVLVTLDDALVLARLRKLGDSLERLWRYGWQCENEEYCDPACPHGQAEILLREVGRL